MSPAYGSIRLGLFFVGNCSQHELTLNGTLVTANQTISVANINSGLLVFTPTANANGINDAPVLTPYSPTLPLTENAGAYTALISTLIGSGVTDADSGAVQGIAIRALTLAGGTLEYSIDGTNWITASGLSTTNALLLRSTDQMRFTPSTANGGTTFINYNAWDQTSGSAGGFANVTSTGGITAFSSASDTITVNVTSVNDAPVMDNSGNMSFTAITEDQTSNSDQTVASVIASAGGDRITDVDTSAVEGIAITATTNGTGTWQYSIDSGSSWTSVGTVSSTSALLLRSTDLLRFKPDTLNGTTGDVSFCAWDQTTGTAGNKATTASSGGTTAFSTATEVASITVSSVNDAPIGVFDTATAVEAGGTTNGTAGTNPTGNVLTNDTDVDSGDTKAVSGVAAGVVGYASGSVATGVTGSFGSINIAANGAYTYTVDNSNTTVQALRTNGQTITDVFTYTMSDTGGLTGTTQITITIQGANDAPTAVVDSATAIEAGGLANVLECGCSQLDNTAGLRNGQWPKAFHQLTKVHAVDKLHNEIGQAVLLPSFEYLNDVLVIELSKQSHLSRKTRNGLRRSHPF